jgi:hypothetical protein
MQEPRSVQAEDFDLYGTDGALAQISAGRFASYVPYILFAGSYLPG